MPSWTADQEKVINLRDRNILVSAGAGSGKTAVLVERIIKIITDSSKPVNIDQLVVVTFTNAAAAEMRERIGKALQKCLENNPEDQHIQKQQALLHNAHICTIDSFCLYIVKNYFNEIGLLPDFRMGDEGELVLMKKDVLSELLEDEYATGNTDFINLVECVAPGKNDNKLEELVFKLYKFSMSHPDSKGWLRNCSESYNIQSKKDIDSNRFICQTLEHTGRTLLDMKKRLETACDICQEPDGPEAYLTALESDIQLMDKLCSCMDYESCYEAFSRLSFERLSTKKQPDVNENKKKQVKGIRDDIKTALGKMKDGLFNYSPEELLNLSQGVKGLIRAICDLTIKFVDRYQESKLAKKVVDFSDIEHYALNILTGNDKKGRSEVAKQLASSIYEIFIDEYQDSNQVQEEILTRVSGIYEGRNNIFMVGDVKQSIYRFRMADPGLFMDKYQTYTSEDSSCQRVDLHANFRSRHQVLDTVNYMFDQLMHRDTVGEVEYDDAARLIPRAEYPNDLLEEGPNDTEIMLISHEEEENLDPEISDWIIEARAVAERIQRMVKEEGFTVRDEDNPKQMRPVTYGDIAILMRSPSSVKDIYAAELEAVGVPVQIQSTTGYFNTREVQVVLALLQIIDNPKQDIYLASVLKSPIGGLDSGEMAEIRVKYPEGDFYTAVMSYRDSQENQSLNADLQKKIREFFLLIDDFRMVASYMSVDELIDYTLQKTDYLHYITAMPEGLVRRQNILMLMEKAADYEQTSYKGLFNFLRYIELLKKYNVDFPEPDASQVGVNSVRIMSIHKSKGLEFPVVFLCGTSKNFNKMDLRDGLVLHRELGIGMDYIDAALRLRVPSVFKKSTVFRVNMESMSEELRVLYVALTRPKEKLIIPGMLKDINKKLNSYAEIARATSIPISFSQMMSASSMLDWIIMSLMRSNKMGRIVGQLENTDIEQADSYLYKACPNLQISLMSAQEVCKAYENIGIIKHIEDMDTSLPMDNQPEDYYQIIEDRLNFKYPQFADTGMKTKMSVSELKKRAYQQLDPEEQEAEFYKEEVIQPYVPQFIEATGEHAGIRRGNLYHKILECYDYKVEDLWGSFDSQIEEMIRSGKIAAEDRELIFHKTFKCFFESDLAKGMKAAAKRDKLYREQPFVMGVEAKRIYKDTDSKELIIVQGIIDAYYEEDDGIVLLDYKTDRVDSAEQLVKRYKEQLNLYEEAIERFSGKRVKAKFIYAFCLNETIEI